MFELDHSHPLAQGLAFGLFFSMANTGGLQDSSLLRNHARFSVGGVSYSEVLQRYGVLRRISGTPAGADVGALAANPITVTDGLYWSNAGWIDATGWDGTGTFLTLLGTDNANDYLGIRNNNTLGFYLSDYTRQNISVGAVAALRHYCITRSGNAISFYADGRLFGTQTSSTGFAPNTKKICASTNNSSAFIHKVYDPVVYNRGLSPAEIALLADRTDPMLDGLIRDKKPAPKHWHLGALPKVYPINIVGSQVGETIKWTWGE